MAGLLDHIRRIKRNSKSDSDVTAEARAAPLMMGSEKKSEIGEALSKYKVQKIMKGSVTDNADIRLLDEKDKWQEKERKVYYTDYGDRVRYKSDAGLGNLKISPRIKRKSFQEQSTSKEGEEKNE